MLRRTALDNPASVIASVEAGNGRPPARGEAPARACALAVLAFLALTLLVVSLWAAEGHPKIERASGLALAGGVVAAAVASVAVFVAFRRQARQIAETERHLSALEALHRLSAAVSGRLGGDDASGREPLRQLCDATLSLLDVDRCGILLLDQDHSRLELLAAAGDMPPDTPPAFDLASLPACRCVLINREVLFVEDTGDPTETPGEPAPPPADEAAPPAPAAATSLPRNNEVVTFFRARSMVLIPLEVQGRCIGLMALSASRARRFDDSERRLAELMGAQASVVLANARLLVQTREAASRARSALASYKAMLDQRHALTNVLQAGSFEESMQRIVRIAPGAVGVDRAGIGLTTEREGELVMVAHTGSGVDALIGRPQDVSALDAGQALRQRRTVVVTDALRQGGAHPSVQYSLPQASIVYAPLFAADGEAVVAPAGRPIGLLIFVRERPGEFSAEQMELMRAFCVRAAGVIETARLLDRTRQDAQTKSELLRELNHRVKNNLAGIGALLTVARPPMTPQVEQWLERVIDRTRAMAGAHDLFTGGSAEVALAALLDQTLESIPLPPGVIVRQHVDGAADVRLDTGRAVTLAMVVNELCHNAVTHGLRSSRGTVDVSARLDNRVDGHVIVEVSDDPSAMEELAASGDRRTSGAGAGSDNSRRGGVGLELVDGLVRRELRGAFSLRRNDGGGTMARVEFRLDRADLPVHADEALMSRGEHAALSP